MTIIIRGHVNISICMVTYDHNCKGYVTVQGKSKPMEGGIKLGFPLDCHQIMSRFLYVWLCMLIIITRHIKISISMVTYDHNYKGIFAAVYCCWLVLAVCSVQSMCNGYINIPPFITVVYEKLQGIRRSCW